MCLVSQSVKEVLQSLVDDGLVQGDKIGSSNFFWSFPSQRGAMVQARLSTVKETRDTYQKQIEELRISVEEEKGQRLELDSRKEALRVLASLKAELAQLEGEINAYGACDPIKIEEKKRGVVLAKEAAIRWTDNYSVLLSHFRRQTGVEAQEIKQFLGVEDEYEDIY
ncbi:Meiotic nuclear division protein 1 [Pleurotus ostreatus]|nr:Meiotic nuclear division protein 1 [Pleurotus ostreatus]